MIRKNATSHKAASAFTPHEIKDLLAHQHPAVQSVVRKRFLDGLPGSMFRFGGGDAKAVDDAGLKVDLLIASPQDNHKCEDVFHALRWGGQFVCVGDDARQLAQLQTQFANTARSGLLLEVPLTRVGLNPFKFNLPLMDRRSYYFVVRKVMHFLPHEYHSCFTFDVTLAPDPNAPDGYVVRKKLPEMSWLVASMAHRYPDTEEEVLNRRATHLMKRVFPMVLSREVQMLKHIRKTMPPQLLKRLPILVRSKQNSMGQTIELDMSWLRLARRPIAHLDFASESIRLLKALHEIAGVWHLDMRLDNILMTREGVAFVDFGSAVLASEDISRSRSLQSFYYHVMQTSEIQMVLKHMIDKGQVTYPPLKQAYGKVDALVDTFYLAVQIIKPLKNPDLAQLIDYQPGSPESQKLLGLAKSFLSPPPGRPPRIRNIADLLKGLEQISQDLNHEPDEAAQPTDAVASAVPG